MYSDYEFAEEQMEMQYDNGYNAMQSNVNGDENEWISYEEKKYADRFGGNFIKVVSASDGTISFFCKICKSELNGKKSLEAHCSGMKHLKKRDTWKKLGEPDALNLKESLGDIDSLMKSSASYKKPTALPARYREKVKLTPDVVVPRFSSDPKMRPSDPSTPKMRPRDPSTPKNVNSEKDQRRELMNRFHSRGPHPGPPPKFSEETKKKSPNDVIPLKIPKWDSEPAGGPPKLDAKDPAKDLLKKVKKCHVVNVGDSKAALYILSGLTKALKDFYTKKGHSDLVEMISQCEQCVNNITRLQNNRI